jgi:hypothetical protein
VVGALGFAGAVSALVSAYVGAAEAEAGAVEVARGAASPPAPEAWRAAVYATRETQ